MFHKLVNTELFSESANFFRKHGVYTKAPKGTKDYKDYWEMEKNRCRDGHTIGDLWIPGRYYHYLNFFVMERVSKEKLEKSYADRNSASVGVAQKYLDFPRFSEMQYEWFMFKHIAWNGGEFMGVKSPGGRHICCAKTRDSGFSYMEAHDGVYNYTFIPGSKSFYLASLEQYLNVDGILNKVAVALTFVNRHQHPWAQNRHKKNTILHQRASYIDAFGEEHGTLSEIVGVTVNDPNKTRGKRGRKITFEEAGSFKNLTKAYTVAQGSMKSGDLYVGQMSVFGTGGEEGPSIEGLEDMFTNPESWDMLAFPNVWGAEGAYDTCGYFVPSFRGNFSHIDPDGNIDYKSAIASDNRERAKITKQKQLDMRKAEFPQTPEELFTRLDNNEFNVTLINRQINKIKSSTTLQTLVRHGKLIYSNEKGSINNVEFLIDPKANPIVKYPHSNGDDLTGCVSILEKPILDQSGKVPTGMYQITVDPYYKEDAEDKTSLFDIRVWKQPNKFSNSYSRLPVAWFSGRPKRLETCHKILFQLCEMYNCTVQSEIAGGGMGILDYAKKKRKLHLLEFEPEMIHNKELASNQKNRSYFMNMTAERKKMGMTYLIQWHDEQRGVREDGSIVTNIDHIYDIAFLRELAKGGLSNSDRMSSAIIYMFMAKEFVAKQVKSVKNKTDFFNRELFGGSTSGDNGSVSRY